MMSKTERSAATPHLGKAARSGNLAQPRGTHSGTFSDLRGVSQLVVAAVAGVTNIVEEMHRNIARISPIIGPAPTGRARGISGLVYRSVRGVTQVVGFGLNTALAPLTPLLIHHAPSPRREALLAALNGVLGDYLVASRNPLAISMSLRQQGRPLELVQPMLATRFAPAGGKLLVLVHGLCMNDLEWQREGHDHGISLAQDLGYIPLYLHYNSGQHISTNGREFAALMERLVEEWPVPVSEVVMIGHSMGGLVARSACYYAKQANHAWLRHLKQLICLGTPHHGAPLERAGNWVNMIVGISPYTAPFTRLGKIRSAGVKDLRYGNILDEDWERRGSEHPQDLRQPAPLPEGVQCFVIAATSQPSAGHPGWHLPGDGLVPVESALGQHENTALTLPIPASRREIFYGLNHFDLLSSREVYGQIHRWLLAQDWPSESPDPG
jgi:pimeloyl-ACP methyl ester carboxylesterase